MVLLPVRDSSSHTADAAVCQASAGQSAMKKL